MDLRVLSYFLAVANYENITKAAEELHLTQPTLSRQLSDLEHELGTKLLIRGKRKTTLTEEGLFLRDRAEELITLAKKTIDQFAHIDELAAGDIYIGCGETQAVRCVLQAITPLRQSYSHIHIHLLSGNGRQVADYIQKGLIDFGVLCQMEPPEGYEWRQIPYDDKWGLVMHRENLLSRQNAITPSDLLQEPLIISQQLNQNTELDSWLGMPKKALHVVSTYNLPYNAAFLVEQKQGSMLTFDGLIPVGTAARPDLIFRPLMPELMSHNYLVWKPDRILSRASRLVRDCFEKAF